MNKVDLTVYGAGIMGLSCAYVAARGGRRVRVIDPHGVGAGSSGGVVGALAPHTPERWNAKKAFQFESLIMARRFWPEVERISGLSSGYGVCGRLQGINREKHLELAYARALEAKTLWEGKAQWNVTDDLTNIAAQDWRPHSETGFWIHDTLSARIHPLRACRALAKAIEALGGEICTDAQAEGAVIHATGWNGLKEMSASMEEHIGDGVKGQAILLQYDMHEAPQIYAENLHIIAHADGTTAIGSTSERDFSDPYSNDGLADELLERAYAALPCLRGAKEIKRWAGVRPRAKSRAPLLGAWPRREGHYIANGGFKIGLGMAPLSAKVLIDTIFHDGTSIPEEFNVSTLIQ